MEQLATPPTHTPPKSWTERFFAWSEWQVQHGIRVTVVVPGRAARQSARARLSASLDLLEAYAPEQLARIPILMDFLAVAPLTGDIGVWRRDLRAAVLNHKFVLAADTTPERMASVIIHELTHARLERAGFQYVEPLRARCERVCFLAERNFLARLPASRERQKLEQLNDHYLSLAATAWSDAAFANRFAAWLAHQPLWHRATYAIVDFLRRAHRAALPNGR